MQEENRPSTGFANRLEALRKHRQGMNAISKCDFDAAVRLFTEVLQLDPDNAEDYHNRAEAHKENGEYDKAIADCTEAIRIDPTDTRAYCIRGGVYEKLRKLDRAICDYSEAIRVSVAKETVLEWRCAEAYLKRGMIYRDQGEHDKAKADFAEAKSLGYLPGVQTK